MKNQLYMVNKPVRLMCIWAPTGDVKKPLACVWVEAAVPRAASALPADSDARGLRLCA
ncbi:MAG: hypothetical protein ABSD72_02805 [Terracidiphilus sp.]|jgi:hypothetical protein